jgi:hypothetical protein
VTEPAEAAGRAILAEAVDACRTALGERLLAAYALGSLAHGGFSPLVSDVDLGLVLADPIAPGDASALEEVAGRVRAGATELHDRLSVFWGSPSTLGGATGGGRFPPLDRLDLLEHGVLLWGADVRAGLPRPVPGELLVAGAEFALDFLAGIPRPGAPTGAGLGSLRPAGDETIEEIRQPELLVARGVRRLTKLVLFPVRFLYTAATGRVGTNRLAVEHHLAAAGAPSTRLVGAGLAWRTVAPQPGEAVALLEAEMLPLYLHYLDDHIGRLEALGRSDLVGAFAEWRRLLCEGRGVGGVVGS